MQETRGGVTDAGGQNAFAKECVDGRTFSIARSTKEHDLKIEIKIRQQEFIMFDISSADLHMISFEDSANGLQLLVVMLCPTSIILWNDVENVFSDFLLRVSKGM